MPTTTYRGVVRGGVVLLDKETPLKDGAEVLVTPVAGPHGSGSAIVAAMENAAKVPAEWVDELEQLIAAGRRAPSRPVSFADEPGNQEKR